MKKLIFICGASGIGKSTACAALYRKLNRSALVDSDYCRMIHPFEFTDEQKRIVEDNMATMLINYLGCSTIDTVIFLYGFHGPRKQIFNNIMARISNTGIPYSYLPIILECEYEENMKRAYKDGRDECNRQIGRRLSVDGATGVEWRRMDLRRIHSPETAREAFGEHYIAAAPSSLNT